MTPTPESSLKLYNIYNKKENRMKKLSILSLVITVMMTGLSSCSSFSGETRLKTEIDTMSFYFGQWRSDGIKNYLTSQAGVDTAYMDVFYQGFREGAKNYGPKEVAYLEGMRIAHLINNQWIGHINRDLFMDDSSRSVNREAILSGFYQGMSQSDATQILHAQTHAQLLMDAIRDKHRKEKYAESIAANEQFLADNRKKEGVQTTESGLQYKILTEGRGEIPGERSKVSVHYQGRLIDGTVFDSSPQDRTPASFQLNRIIKGWSEALRLMPTGSHWELYIPQELAYGSAGQGTLIPPYSTLIFDIELVGIENEK
jgi:FKBP-type peptidyl-prolyl cis-trans isomerase FklB